MLCADPPLTDALEHTPLGRIKGSRGELRPLCSSTGKPGPGLVQQRSPISCRMRRAGPSVGQGSDGGVWVRVQHLRSGKTWEGPQHSGARNPGRSAWQEQGQPLALHILPFVRAPAEGHADPKLLGFAQPPPPPRAWTVGWCHPMALERCYKCWWHLAALCPLRRHFAPVSMSSALFPVCVLDRFAFQPRGKGSGLLQPQQSLSMPPSLAVALPSLGHSGIPGARKSPSWGLLPKP